MLLTATATVTNSSRASRFLRLGDGERVQRLGEVPVEQQAGRHRGEHGGPEPAHHRDRHHRDQVDEQVVGQVQVRPGGGQDQREQREQGRGEQRAAQPPPHADRGVARRAESRGRTPRKRRRAPSRRPPRMPGYLPTFTSVSRRACQRNTRPESGAGQRAAASTTAACDGGRPGRPQLRVRRPGEAGRGEPADAGQEDRGDRLGGERHAAGDRRAEDQHPGRGQPCRAGRRRPCPRPGTWRRRPAARTAPASPGIRTCISSHLLFQPRKRAISAFLTDP